MRQTTTGRALGTVLPVLLLLGCSLYLPRLGSSDLWDPWEPKYAQTARETAQGGTWLVPHYRDDERLNKPPMTYWLIALSQAVVGVNETGARLPSALLAILGSLALGGVLAARGRPLEGFLAGGALLTSPQWLLLGRFATPDMPLACFLGLALALALGLPAVTGSGPRRMLLLVSALAVAAAAMTDGLRGLLLPAWAVLGWGALRWSWKGPLALAAVAGLYVWAQFTFSVPLNLVAAGAAIVLAGAVLRQLAGLSIPMLVAGVLVIALLVVPWVLIANAKAPDEMSILKRYKHAFNLGETVKRHRADWHYVVRTAAVGSLPWAALAVLGLLVAFRPREDPLAAILAGALLGGVLFFTLSEAKMGHFYGVLQPAIAGLAGIGALRVAERLRWSSLVGAGALAAVWFVVWKNPARLLETATVKSNLYGIDLSYAVAGAALGWAMIFVAAKIAKRPVWAAASVLPAALLAGTLGLHVVPSLEKKKSLGPLWQAYLDDRSAEEPVGFLAQTKDSIFYYSNLAVHGLGDLEDAVEFLEEPGVQYMIMTTPTITHVVGASPEARWVDVYREHPTHRLFRRDPRPEPAE